jgi:hypothetical protein
MVALLGRTRYYILGMRCLEATPRRWQQLDAHDRCMALGIIIAVRCGAWAVMAHGGRVHLV